jgi:uncharacterized protein (TIGR00297 family)
MQVPGFIILLSFVGVTLLLSQYLSKKGGWPAFLARKLLHIAGVGALTVSPFIIYDDTILISLVLIFSLILFFAVRFRWLGVDIYNRPSWGIALFPLSFLLLWFWWGREQLDLIVYPMLVLTLADAGAALIGKLSGKLAYNLTGDDKTIPGSMAFALFSIGILGFLPLYLLQIDFPIPFPFGEMVFRPAHIIIIVCAISFIAAALEGATSGGGDNVTVPLSVSWMLAVLPGLPITGLAWLFPLILLHVLLAVWAFKKRWLDLGGAVVAGILGLIICIGGGWFPWILIGLFFLSGSILSKMEASNVLVSGSKLGKPRDYRQVLSNGAVALICMIWYGISRGELPLFLFCVSIAISTSDTWSSSIGNWAGGTVVDIFGFRPLPVGISGGVSWQGTLAGLAGATIIGWLSFWWGGSKPLPIILFGFFGMLADSAIGSKWQVRYQLHGKMLEDGAGVIGLVPEKGVKWLTNDLVNILSNAIITFFAGVAGYFLGIRG